MEAWLLWKPGCYGSLVVTENQAFKANNVAMANNGQNEIMANQTSGLSRIIKAWRYSVQGLMAAWRHEAAFRQEALLAIIAIIVACCLPVSVLEKVLLTGSLLLVLIIELLNSAIEALTDRVSPEWHELAGRAKDMASAAVLLTLLLAVITWGGVLWERFS